MVKEAAGSAERAWEARPQHDYVSRKSPPAGADQPLHRAPRQLQQLRRLIERQQADHASSTASLTGVTLLLECDQKGGSLKPVYRAEFHPLVPEAVLDFNSAYGGNRRRKLPFRVGAARPASPDGLRLKQAARECIPPCPAVITDKPRIIAIEVLPVNMLAHGFGSAGAASAVSARS